MHPVRRLGSSASVDICVTDRRHDLVAGDHGYYNMIGHSAGRSVREQEAHTARRIAEMRKTDAQKRRQRGRNERDNPRRQGAIPSALLFSYKRKYGNDYLQHVEAFMKREGLWWGD